MNKFDKFLDILKYSKLPTILLIATLLSFSYSLIKGEGSINPSVISGSFVGIIAMLFAIFSYADYRAREKIDHILSKYESALDNISATHSRYEKVQRNTLVASRSKKVGSKYEIECGGSLEGTAGDINEL